MGEIASIIRGERVTKSQVSKQGTYPVISGGATPMGYIEKFNREAETITIAQYGSAGFVNWQKSRFWANDVCYCVFSKDLKDLKDSKDIIDAKFLYYFLKNSGFKIDQMINRDAIPYHLPQIKLESLSIPIPPVELQEKIVAVLDRFEALVNDLTEGLPAEIAAVKERYEYYRNQLLTFKNI